MLLVTSLQLEAPLDSITWTNLNLENPNLTEIDEGSKKNSTHVFLMLSVIVKYILFHVSLVIQYCDTGPRCHSLSL